MSRVRKLVTSETAPNHTTDTEDDFSKKKEGKAIAHLGDSELLLTRIFLQLHLHPTSFFSNSGEFRVRVRVPGLGFGVSLGGPGGGGGSRREEEEGGGGRRVDG
jgi:hypothetical protein